MQQGTTRKGSAAISAVLLHRHNGVGRLPQQTGAFSVRTGKASDSHVSKPSAKRHSRHHSMAA